MYTTLKTSFPFWGRNTFEEMADEMFRNSYVSDRAAYPTDIIQILDDNGQIKGYEILMALAGIDKENVDVTTDNDALVITVKKSEKAEDKKRVYVQKGISQRSSESRFGLYGIDKNGIKATCTDGMLKVELPLAEEVKPRAIKIG